MESDLEDVLPLSPELRSEMERWLPEYERSVRRDHRRGLLPSDYLTQSYMPTGTPPGMTLVDGKRRQNGRSGVINPGHPATRSYEVVTAGLRRLGLPDQNQGIHTLRRSAARQIFDALVETRRYDGALRVVQSLLHHSTRETTDEYIGLSSEALTRDEFLRTAILLGEPERPALASVSPGPQGLPRSDSRQELAWDREQRTATSLKAMGGLIRQDRAERGNRGRSGPTQTCLPSAAGRARLVSLVWQSWAPWLDSPGWPRTR